MKKWLREVLILLALLVLLLGLAYSCTLIYNQYGNKTIKIHRNVDINKEDSIK